MVANFPFLLLGLASFSSPAGDPVADDDVLAAIKAERFHQSVMIDLIGRKPLRKEVEQLRGKSREAVVDLLLARKEFWENVRVPGEGESLNQELEKAGRVADFLEFGELMCRDALDREESCGGHFRGEYQDAEGEAKRNDKEYGYVAAWEFRAVDKPPKLHKEWLKFETVKPSTRSYK